jgi:hypothetical protein
MHAFQWLITTQSNWTINVPKLYTVQDTFFLCQQLTICGDA